MMRTVARFVIKYMALLKVVLGTAQGVMLCVFVVLVTSVGFHWWTVPGGAGVRHGLLVVLVRLCVVFGLVNLTAFLVRVSLYGKGKRDYVRLYQLVASGEVSLILMLIAVWGGEALRGKPSAVPLVLALLVVPVVLAVLILLSRAEVRRIVKRARAGLP